MGWLSRKLFFSTSACTEASAFTVSKSSSSDSSGAACRYALAALKYRFTSRSA